MKGGKEMYAYCEICGDRENIEYRSRSRLNLCEACHQSTPAKATLTEFLKITKLPISTNREIVVAQEYFDDYKLSNYGDVEQYWESLSE